MSDKNKYEFPGSKIDVTWDGRLCIHIAECGRSKGDLFVGGRKPWCQPDLAQVEEVVDVIERCPSGSLTYAVKDGSIEERPSEKNTVLVSYNGPYFVRGELDIENAPKGMTGIKFRAALCRCGRSKNKPFCDNSHEKIKFQDYGAVGEKGEETTQSGGKLSIKPSENGPLLLSGNFTIISGNGRAAWTGTQVALCRCGASNNKPFCDGSHKSAGFISKK